MPTHRKVQVRRALPGLRDRLGRVWGSSDSCLSCPTAWQRITWLGMFHISARVFHCSDKLSKEPSLVVWSPAGGPLTRWDFELGVGEKMIFLTPWP